MIHVSAGQMNKMIGKKSHFFILGFQLEGFLNFPRSAKGRIFCALKSKLVSVDYVILNPPLIKLIDSIVVLVSAVGSKLSIK